MKILEPDYFTRPIASTDEPFLWEMLYQALYVPEGSPPFPREILSQPEIRRYVENWGRADDLGFVALTQTTRQPIGAAWIRLLKGENHGYGYIDDYTPELTIAVVPVWRGRGIGTALLERVIEAAQSSYASISLSVSRDNPAIRLYRRLGFEALCFSGTSLTMRRRLRPQ
jgi:ribosomal protein S18 acetylase RimI-like enzyme